MPFRRPSRRGGLSRPPPAWAGILTSWRRRSRGSPIPRQRRSFHYLAREENRMSANVNGMSLQQTGWVDRLFSNHTVSPEYQELKFTLHRKLLDRINLEILSSVGVERVRTEV